MTNQPSVTRQQFTQSQKILNNKMAAREVFLPRTLTCSLYRSNNRFRMNYLNCARCLSLSRGTKDSKPGSSKEKNTYDVAIVGGGALGSSSAYFLANRLKREMGKICVIERDPTVSSAASSFYSHCTVYIYLFTFRSGALSKNLKT